MGEWVRTYWRDIATILAMVLFAFVLFRVRKAGQRRIESKVQQRLDAKLAADAEAEAVSAAQAHVNVTTHVVNGDRVERRDWRGQLATADFAAELDHEYFDEHHARSVARGPARPRRALRVARDVHSHQPDLADHPDLLGIEAGRVEPPLSADEMAQRERGCCPDCWWRLGVNVPMVPEGTLLVCVDCRLAL